MRQAISYRRSAETNAEPSRFLGLKASNARTRESMNRRSVIQSTLAAFAVGLCGAFAIFVWPTAYRPLPVDLSRWSGEPVPVAARENRFTESVQLFFVGYGWVTVSEHASAPMSPGDSLAALARKYSPSRSSDEWRELARRGWFDTTAGRAALLADSAEIRRRIAKPLPTSDTSGRR
jgi:hypothetical protein